jgi:RNA polymerase sigma-70 factor, ECF subfamily
MTREKAPLSVRFANQLTGAALTGRTSSPEEGCLLAAARRGDAEAYGSLVRSYQDRLCCSLRPICKTIEDADDAAQEAFLRGFLKLDSFTGSSSFYTWLYRIAVNVAITAHRRRPLCPLDDSIELTARWGQSDERLLREERIAQVQKSLQSLTAEHRTMLVLRELDHWNYDEIAAILRIPVGTVRSRLHRARIELRGRLGSIQDR